MTGDAPPSPTLTRAVVQRQAEGGAGRLFVDTLQGAGEHGELDALAVQHGVQRAVDKCADLGEEDVAHCGGVGWVSGGWTWSGRRRHPPGRRTIPHVLLRLWLGGRLGGCGVRRTEDDEEAPTSRGVRGPPPATHLRLLGGGGPRPAVAGLFTAVLGREGVGVRAPPKITLACVCGSLCRAAPAAHTAAATTTGAHGGRAAWVQGRTEQGVCVRNLGQRRRATRPPLSLNDSVVRTDGFLLLLCTARLTYTNTHTAKHFSAAVFVCVQANGRE